MPGVVFSEVGVQHHAFHLLDVVLAGAPAVVQGAGQASESMAQGAGVRAGGRQSRNTIQHLALTGQCFILRFL